MNIYMGRVKNGNIDGSWIEWHENGQKKLNLIT